MGNTYVMREEIAHIVGPVPAMVYERIRYMAEQNEIQGDSEKFKDGRYWIVNTISGWKAYFSFLSEKQIRSALEKLREANLLIVSKRGSTQGNQTLWYAVNEEPQDVDFQMPKRANASAQKGKSGIAQKGKSINDKTPKTPKTQSVSFDDFWVHWPDKNNKERARKNWAKLSKQDRQEAFDAAKAGWFDAWRMSNKDANPIHCGTYLTDKRWQDEGVLKSGPVNETTLMESRAATIRKGKPFLCTDYTDAMARDLIAANLVTPEQCRTVGLNP